MNCLFIIITPTLIVPFVYYQAYKGVGEKLTSILRMLSSNGLQTGNTFTEKFDFSSYPILQIAGKEENLYKKVKLGIIVANGITLVAAVLLASNNGWFFLADHMNFISKCLLCPLSFMFGYCNGLPPITSGIHSFP